MMKMPCICFLALMVALASPVLAGDSPFERATLAGLNGVHVLVEGMNPDVERDGLAKSTMQTDVELRLRQVGIRVLTGTEQLLAPGRPYLYLRVSTLKDREGFYAIAIELVLLRLA